ncbi:MAG: type II toxin-antitoxin system RelE/ParE family toxin [Candidatus Melainabacteria bacterium]|nr:MAG: type II toxin-antitoxin system RelE/ParE family toxin [Candidatus Melainabacteria bacterium]
MNEAAAPRTFKTEWFAKAAKKANISDADLCKAIAQVRIGQCDDLGGGVFKKRLQKNLYRSIIVAKGGKYWIYSYLFAKKDRENITQEELKVFRELADIYTNITDEDIELEKTTGILVEICHGKKV